MRLRATPAPSRRPSPWLADAAEWRRAGAPAMRERLPRADALDHASRNDHPQPRAEPGGERADREHHQSPQEHHATPQTIGQSTCRDEQRPEEDRVHGQHPAESSQRFAFELVRSHVRERDRHRVQVEPDDECTRSDCNSYQTLAPRAIGHDRTRAAPGGAGSRSNSSAALRHSKRSSTSSRQPSPMNCSSALGA